MDRWIKDGRGRKGKDEKVWTQTYRKVIGGESGVASLVYGK